MKEGYRKKKAKKAKKSKKPFYFFLIRFTRKSKLMYKVLLRVMQSMKKSIEIDDSSKLITKKNNEHQVKKQMEKTLRGKQW